MRVVFMGTPEFAVATLAEIINAGFDVVTVVTIPDKPAGRGLQLKESAVKQYAVEHNIPVLQPEKLKDEEFISNLKTINADLFVVVAFRMLPEVVWAMPAKGTINLHGSLLPHYRGAAPINWALINGETQSGVTTFFIEKEIDTGNIIFQDSVPILAQTYAGELHDELMQVGARLVVKTLKAIETGEYPKVSQQSLIAGEPIKTAPKLNKENTRIDWKKTVFEIYNLIRGLSPYPAAWTTLTDTKGKETTAKIFAASFEIDHHNNSIGSIKTNGKTNLEVAVADGWI